MDATNRFETTATFALQRLEYGLLLTACSIAAAFHYADIDWLVFAGLFLIIDVVGYLPGAVAFRRRNGEISKVYYVLYNTMHSMITWSIVLAAWSILAEPQWAFLAIPIHLAGDRAIFGNSMKSFGVSYEPQLHPAFRRFQAELAAARHWNDRLRASQPRLEPAARSE